MAITLVYIDVYSAATERQKAFVRSFADNGNVTLHPVVSETFVDWHRLNQKERSRFVQQLRQRVLDSQTKIDVGVFHFTDTAKYDGQELDAIEEVRRGDEILKNVLEIFRAVRPKCRNAIFYTGGTPRGDGWIQRSVNTAQQVLTKTEVKQLVEWAQDDFKEEKRPAFLLSRMIEALPALAILCQGCLAVWDDEAGQAMSREAIDNKVKEALEAMGMGGRGSSSAQSQGKKWRDVCDESWWKDCFNPTTVQATVEGELRGSLNQKPDIAKLVAWIAGEEPQPGDGNFENAVARAYLEIREELKPHA